MLKDTLKKVKYRVRNRLVLSLIFESLAAIGVNIRPFYLSQEFLSNDIDQNLKPELEPYAAEFLSSSEIKNIYDHPETKRMMRDNNKLLEEGYRCFASKYNDEIVTYLWLNLVRCHEVYPFNLKEDEAYLTGVFTFRTYRGKNLALFLRHQLYKHLRHIGRTKVYSLIGFFNTPAIKLNKKLKANPLKIIINVELFNKYNWNIITRSPKEFLLTI